MQIHWTPKAKRNLSQIELFIAKENPTASIATSLHLVKKIRLLSEQPAMGRPGQVLGTRELVISKLPYIATYRIKSDERNSRQKKAHR